MPHRVRHAKAYPFAIPERSYLYDKGAARDLDAARLEKDGRVPVLAAGSNQSPEQIGRKYAALGGDVVIPAQRGRLQGFDVVYAAHLSSYGSLPATFQASPEAAVTVFVLWLDAAQLQRMHETEGNYTYDHLSGITVALDDGAGTLGEAYAYSSKVGCLNHGGRPLALTEIAAQGRAFPAATQSEALGHLRDRLAPGRALDDFILGHIEDPDLHRARSRSLGSDALPLDFARRVVATL